MKLLQELNEVQTMITESKDGSKKHYIQGIFAQADLKNRNGRIYPKAVMESAVKAYQPLIEGKRALGELNHPNHPQVNLERASHIIESLKFDGNNVIGKAKLLEGTPMGKIAIGLIEGGVQIGVSTRGLGSIVEQNGTKVVQNDFNMSAIDIVGDPSGIDCWVNGLMEGSEWIYEAASGSWILAEQLRSKASKMTSIQLAENQAKMFSTFLASLK